MRLRAYDSPVLRLALLSLLALPALGNPVERAKAAEARGDRLGALDAWNEAVDGAPDDAAPYLGLGKLQLKMKDPAAAAETYARLVEKVPGYARGRYRLALALRKAQRYGEAADAYRAYISAAPDDPDARYGLAETLRQLGDQGGALEAYRSYVGLEKRESEAKWVARAREQIGRIEASQAAQPEPATQAPSQEPEPTADGKPAAAGGADPDALFAERAYAQAAAGYGRVVQERPDAAVPRYRMALSSASAGKFADAERQAAHAERLDPGNPTAADLAALSRARRTQGKKARAKPTVEAAQAALDEGRARTAERLAAEALEAAEGEERARGLRVRAAALLALGRAPESMASYKAAAALEPPSSQGWLALADAALAAGDPPAARYYLELAAKTGATGDPAARRAAARLEELPAGEGP